MKKLVTGATGFIGMHLVNELLRNGDQVIALTRRSAQVTTPGLTWMPYPKSVDEWRSSLTNVSTVYHLAWSTVPKTASDNPAEDARDNIIPAVQLLEAAADMNVHIVFASSGGTIYGKIDGYAAREDHGTRPISAYGVSKLTVENYLQFYCETRNLSSVSMRIANPYGVGQNTKILFGAVSTFCRAALTDQRVTIYGDGTVIRDYIYIADLISALMKAGSVSKSPRILNLGSGVGTSLNDIIEVVGNILGTPVKVEYVPPRQFDVPTSILDINLAKQSLSWQPLVRFEEGVKMTLDKLKQSMHLE